ncbi:MAG: carbonic anhydrase [Chitinophagales bacterium]|nr:carbonic anhydrase [Chitinophagales bacterium]
MAYKNIKEIFEHNQSWIEEQLKIDSEYFIKLSKRQTPKYLFIGCSDSRVSTEALMFSKPGDVFIHRNIANVIPSNDLNVLSVVNYAVNLIKVKHIVVCGHYGCGGVKTAITATDAGILNPWLGYIRDVYRLHKKELNSIKTLDKRTDRLVELNVLEQCINLVKTRDVQQALLEKRIEIHGWVFDMRTGRLIDLSFNTQKVAKEVLDIYNIVK